MAAPRTLRVLIVDDVALYARFIASVLSKIPDVEVVGHASDGVDALMQTAELQPDLITLDVEMPKLDGLEVLAEIKRRRPQTGVIMVSGLSQDSALLTAEALKLGAFDFVVKPNTKDGPQRSMMLLEESLRPQVEAFAKSRRRMMSTFRIPGDKARPPVAAACGDKQPIEIVAIASSTGGPAALREVLTKLPADIGVPVVVAQHMPANFTKSLAQSLDRESPLAVVEANVGMQIAPGTVYLAPGGLQSRIVGRQGRLFFDEGVDRRDGSPRPSANQLFESLAQCVGGRVLAVVLTGMGEDGKEGATVLWRMGAHVLAQDEPSCVVYGMPRAIAEAGIADEVLPLSAMAGRIQALVAKKRARSSHLAVSK